MRSVLPPNQQGLHSSVQPRSSRIGLLPGGGPSNNGSQSGLPPAASAVAAPAGAAAAAAARAARLRSDAGASTCALWCAVAMGALVHGWPTSSVRGSGHKIHPCLGTWRGWTRACGQVTCVSQTIFYFSVAVVAGGKQPSRSGARSDPAKEGQRRGLGLEGYRSVV